MKKLNKKRLITLGTPSIHAAEDRKSVSTVLPGIMAKIMFPNAYQEMMKIEQLINSSALDWTVVRIINPNVKHKGNAYGTSIGDKPAKMSVSRENVARFMYSVTSQHSYVRQMPIVLNK